CAQLAMMGVNTDSTYRLYVNGQTDKPYDAYCYGMKTSSPAEYLTLPTGPMINYSTWTIDFLRAVTTVTTTYLKVRFGPGTLRINCDDQNPAFVQSAGNSIYLDAMNMPHTVKSVPFGVAAACFTSAPAQGNITLTGTPFAVVQGGVVPVAGYSNAPTAV